jgi:hypothetical protein
MSFLDRYIKYVFMFIGIIIIFLFVYLKYSNMELATKNEILMQKNKQLKNSLSIAISANLECNNTLNKLTNYAVKQDRVLENYLKEMKDAKQVKVNTLDDFINYAN